MGKKRGQKGQRSGRRRVLLELEARAWVMVSCASSCRVRVRARVRVRVRSIFVRRSPEGYG